MGGKRAVVSSCCPRCSIVEEYWIVDVDARVVERRRAGDVRPEIVEQKLDWELSVGVAGTIDLPALFERIL